MDIIKDINESSQPIKEIQKLSENKIIQVLRLAADSYYNSTISLLSDELYDILVERLKLLDPKASILSKVGAPVKDRKILLPYWMGSMNKIKGDVAVINRWIDKYQGPYVISDKLDGISCLLTKTSKLIKLYTRGDGKYGQDISHLLHYINIPKLLVKEDVAIRGELIMTKEKFKKYEKIMSNARNMVGGIVNSKPKSLNTEYAKDVDFVTYEIIEPRYLPDKQMKLLKSWNMLVVYNKVYEEIDIDILQKILRTRKEKSIYEIDGIIVTNNQKYARNISGNPSYSFAFKGTSGTANVKVIDIIWNASKDGLLIPTVHFEPVKLSGAKLEYATGFNAEYIEKNKIGPNAIITIVRSGDVIPYILGVVKPSKESGLPKDDYTWDKNHVDIILNNYNKNKNVIIKRLIRFTKELEIDNLSSGIITKMVNEGYDTMIKIIKMTKNDFLKIPGIKDKLATKLYNNLKTSLQHLDILKLMVASNIFGRGFSNKRIERILRKYPNIVDEYNIKNKEKWIVKLNKIEGFDDITTEKFLSRMPKFQKFYHEIDAIVKIKKYNFSIKKSSRFKDQQIVFTGFRNKEWEKIIESEGGKLSTSVSGKTTLLVYNDGDTNSAKYKNAVSLGIKKISKSEFEELYFA